MEPGSASDARAHRRWLIGLAITVTFGVFGAVMAVLAYNNHGKTPAGASQPPIAPASSSPAAPAPDPDPKPGKPGHGRK